MTTLSFVNQRTYSSALSVLQENGFCECSSCNDFVSEDDSRTVDDETYCEGCAESSNYCEGLEEHTFNDVTEVEGHYYSDSYRNDNCWQDGSGEWFQNETSSVTYCDTEEMWTLDRANAN